VSVAVERKGDTGDPASTTRRPRRPFDQWCNAALFGCGELRPPAGLLTLEEVALRLGTSVRHVRRLADERRIPIVKVGRFVRFDGHEVEHWIHDHRIGVLDAASVLRTARHRRTALAETMRPDDHRTARRRSA
jgi:excisionase family DNA binding protein